ncbi:MAG: caspase family protein [Verrucomicrobiaceae bacterium]|nr:MAG: caspase family protein [Verrucomicrobiaceae bacterium]
MRIRPRIVLFLCLTLIPWTAARAQGQRAALVIGNAKYEPAVGPLRNAVNDASAVAKALRRLGFAVTEVHNVTRDKLMTAVMEFRGKAREAEVALFYFAGHGIQVGAAAW